MKKVLYSLPVVLLLCLAFSLSAFAAVNLASQFTLTSAWIFDADGDRIDRAISNQGNNAYQSGSTIFIVNDGTEEYHGFGFTMTTPGYVRVDPGYYFVFSVRLKDYLLNDPVTEPLTIWVTTSDGLSYALEYVYSFDASMSEWTITAGGKVGDGDNASTLYISNFNVNAPVLSSNMYTHGYSIDMEIYVTTHTTLQQQNHEELLDKIDEAADEIIHEDFGYTTPEQTTDNNASIDNTADFIGDLNDQLSGYYDEMKESIDGTFFEATSGNNLLWCWFALPHLSGIIMILCLFQFLKHIAR